MKAKISARYKGLSEKSKMTNCQQVVDYLENNEVEKNELGQEIVRLDMPGNDTYNFNRRIKDEDLEAICISYMSYVVNLISINLSYNKITHKGVAKIAKLLEFAENIAEINLMGNHIGDEGCEKLSSCLKGKIFLYSLNLNSNQIGNTGLMYINELLYTNSGLLKLDIGSNLYDWDGLIAITTALKHTNSTLQVLNVDDPAYKIQDQDFFTHFGMMFRTNNGIKKISLKLHKLRFEGVQIMTHYLKTYNENIQVLDLSCNQICFQGVNYISEYMAETKCLKSIILASNCIHNQGAKIFAKGIALNESIIHVNLTSNTITDEGLCKLAEGLMQNASVRSLKLFWNNSFGGESISLFNKYLKSKGNDFYPDFVIYVDEIGEMMIAYLETHILNEADYLVC